MMKRLVLTLPFAVLAVFLQGCLCGRVRLNDPAVVRRAEAVVPGETAFADVESILNAQPTVRLPGKGTTLYGYGFADTKTRGLMLVLVNFTRSECVTGTLYVEVDDSTGKVTRVHLPPACEPEWRFWPFGED